VSSAVVIDLAQRFNAKRNGKGWLARCPAHSDKKPSLSIDEGRDGRALLHCHAGCSTDDILAAKRKAPLQHGAQNYCKTGEAYHRLRQNTFCALQRKTAAARSAAIKPKTKLK
jgi:hypothetical protein